MRSQILSFPIPPSCGVSMVILHCKGIHDTFCNYYFIPRPAYSRRDALLHFMPSDYSGMSGRKLRLSVHRKNERRAAHSLPVQIPMQDAGSFTPSSTFEDVPSDLESLAMLPVQIPLQDVGSFTPSSTFEDVPSESLGMLYCADTPARCRLLYAFVNF